MTYPPLIALQHSLDVGAPDRECIQAVLNHSVPYVQYEAYRLLRFQKSRQT
ncbi:MAG: hypothetical protein AAGD25_27795 [Cyanobacteria bacterium P01_F01_bin.150]